MNKEKLLSKNKLNKVFQAFDLDNNGFITKTELKHVMGFDLINEEIWSCLLDEYDINKDGKISKAEFFKLLMKRGEEGEKSSRERHLN